MRKKRAPYEATPNSTPLAVQALHETTKELARVRGLWPRINSVSDQLDRQLAENHFSDKFALAFREKKP